MKKLKGRWHRKLRKISPIYDLAVRTHPKKRPMQLMLCSHGFTTPLMRERFSKVIPRNKSLRRKVCLVIPFADREPEKAFEREKEGLCKFGFCPKRVLPLRKRLDLLLRPDYIYVSGGDPFLLLQTLREMGLLEELAKCVKEKGVVYIGVSAGAYLAAPDIRYVMHLEDNNVISDQQFGALGLVEKGFLCHFDSYFPMLLRACLEASGKPIITIDNDQLLLYKKRKWRYIEE